ncbi:GntR family transcriptional regulator [Streptomyces malaysiensis]|uniref:GntR family transcriptional regulator n=1 Tax=Streptomyces malaysiensis TaxID=92644 RepID=UPI0028C49ECF|nr:GntR family transcriptional regulator [Streptomyces malaysiensis]
MEIDAASKETIGDQIAAQIRGHLVSGRLRTGDRLSSARDLARSLQISFHTVPRGYQTLATEGLIELRRGRGAIVIREIDPGRARLEALAREFAQLSRSLGTGREDALALDACRLRLGLPPTLGTAADVRTERHAQHRDPRGHGGGHRPGRAARTAPRGSAPPDRRRR